MNDLRMMTAKEAAQILEVRIETIYAMILSDKFEWGFCVRGEKYKRNAYYIFRQPFLDFVSAGRADLFLSNK